MIGVKFNNSYPAFYIYIDVEKNERGENAIKES